MTTAQPNSGYTLPVFACAAALAALSWLRDQTLDGIVVDLIEPAQTVEIPIEQVAGITKNSALAVTKSNPGDNIDLTRNTPIWALVEWAQPEQIEQIKLVGGEGIGRQINAEGKAAIYAYAERLLLTNLQHQLRDDEKIQVTIILPEGRQLAARTSNAAFGVVEGLSLLGTTGISHPLSAPGQLEAYRQELQEKALRFDCLVFCIGENGLDLARQLGVNPLQLIKTANWLGPLLVEAGLLKVANVLLFGYHGKLIKLAGGIFMTSNHLADGRLEILTAYCAQFGLATPVLQTVLQSPTTEAALKYLRKLDASDGTDWVNQVYSAIASAIDTRSQNYIHKHSEQNIRVGSVLFDRDRQILVQSATGAAILSQLC